MLASARSISSAAKSPTLRAFASSVHNFDAYRAPTGVGLGISYNSRDMGPLVPPPTPRFPSTDTLPDVPIGCSMPGSKEEQVLKSMLNNKLYLRRRQVPNPINAIANSFTLDSMPHSQFPTQSSSAASALHAPMMVAPASSNNTPDLDVARVGLGLSGLSLSSGAGEDDRMEDDAEVIFEDGEWEYVKASGFKSCKGRVCTPHYALQRNDSWM